MRSILALFVTLPLASSTPLSAAEFFVSPTGSDTNPGTLKQPFATLERARDAARGLRERGGMAEGGITISLRAGDHVRSASLELTAADSGTPDSPVVWRAYGDEQVRLIGGRTLSGFRPVANPDVLSRLDVRARANVRQLNLRALGIVEFGEMRRRGFALNATGHSELFHDGRPMTLARWPNSGEWAHISGFPEGSAEDDGHGGKIGRLAGGFGVDSDRPFGWKDPRDVWVHGYWAWDWANSYERVESMDRARRLIRTAAPHGHYGFRKGQRLFFLNVLEELDEPGEWFLDRPSGVLYFWPPAGAGPDFSVTLSLLDRPLVFLKGASHVTIRGVILEATRADAVVIEGGADNRVQGCLIRDVGNGGVAIRGGTGHGVVDCDITDTGDGGVAATGGDRQTLTPGGHFVEDCHFRRQGRWSKCYVPAISLNGVGLRASHNLIHDHPHAAIIIGGNDHLIEFNEIHHIALETGDVGAIYTGRDFTWRGNRIRHNFIHHTGGVGMGSMGVYMDDCVSGTEIYGNVFYKVQRAAFLGGGRDHRVVNNIFVDCDPAVQLDGRGLDLSPVWRGMVNEFMRSGLAAVPAPLYRERYPAIRDLDRYYGPPGGPAIVGDAFRGVPPEGNVVERNICVGKWLEVGWHAEPGMLLLRDNHVGPDPGFEAPERLDFRLRPDSPVLKAGFRPIPFREIGLRHSGDRKRDPHPLSSPGHPGQ